MSLKDEGFQDFSSRANLRVAFDVWPAEAPPPSSAADVVRGALRLTVGDLLGERLAPLVVLRFSTDGVSLWCMDGLMGVTIEDLVRGIGAAFSPPAHALAVVESATSQPDGLLRAVRCRAMFGDDIVECVGEVVGADGPPAGRSIPRWKERRGTASDDRARWIGVPPTVELRFPMLDAAEA